jgi:hypothetical protein
VHLFLQKMLWISNVDGPLSCWCCRLQVNHEECQHVPKLVK